ncbi:MAG: T9SS type A sorting domain-containing protein [Cyclobacteriaceae bacterium]|nr:T9SS type A sorting domain-containing protein [Cyclobacteriaceae bacterium]
MRLSILAIVLVLFISTALQAQVITSTGAGGTWSSPASWVGGVVPTSGNSTGITIVGPITVAAADYNSVTPLVIDQTTVNTGGSLTIDAGAQVNLAAGTGTDFTVAGTGTVAVNGTFVQIAGSTLTGMTAVNTAFNSGSVYEVQNTTFGTLPTATWDTASTILVTGLNAATSAAASWAQNIGNLTIACPNLGAAAANLAGRPTINGNLTISNTGASGRVVLFSGAGTSTINITGSLTVSGSAVMYAGTSGTVTVNVSGGVVFNTSGAVSRLTQTGTTTLNLNGGNFDLQQGTLNLTSSTGGGTISMNAGNFVTTSGFLQKTGTGAGLITFTGSGPQSIALPPAQISSGTINLTLSKASGDLTLASNLTVSAFTQSAGNLFPGGFTLTISGAISQTGGAIGDNVSGSSLTISGAGAVPVSFAFVPSAAFTAFTLNRTSVTIQTSNDITVSNLTLTAGTFTHSGTLTIADQGSITVNAGVLTNTPAAAGVYDLSYVNTGALVTAAELPAAPSTAVRNFSKSAAGTLTLNKNTNITGTFSVASGSGAFSASTFSMTLGAGAHSIAAASTFSALNITGGTLSQTSATTTTFNGSIALSSGGSINFTSGTASLGTTLALTSDGTGSITFNALAFGTGVVFTAPTSPSITVNGNVSGNGTLTANSGTFIFAGTTTMTGAVRTYHNITVSGSVSGAVGFRVDGDLTNNGTINLTGGTLTWAGNGSFSGSGSTIFNSLTVNASQTMTANSSFSLRAAFTCTGNFTSNATVTYIGTTTLSGAGTKSFKDVVVNGTSLTPTAAHTIRGNVTVTAGTLAAGSSTTTFGGTTTLSGAGSINFNNVTITATDTLTSSSGTVTIAGNFTNNGLFDPAGGTIAFSATGATKSLQGSSAIPFNNITIANTASATDVTNLNTTGVTVTGAVSVAASATLDVDGTGTGVFTLLSSADQPAVDGKIGPLLTGASVSGTFNVQRFITNEGRYYRYLASPVVGATVSQWMTSFPVTGTFLDPSTTSCPGCNTTNPSLYYYDETTQAYVTYPPVGFASTDPVNALLVNGKGYTPFIRQNLTGDNTVTVRGTHPSTAGVTLSTAPVGGDWSLVANPYPCPIVWDNGAGWTKANIGDVISIRDNPSGIFQTFSAAAGTGVIAPGQAFWVQSTAGGASLSVNENAKTISLPSEFFRLSVPAGQDELVVSLTKPSTVYTSAATVRSLSVASDNYDSYDLNNFPGAFQAGVNTLPSLKTRSADGVNLVVNTLAAMACGQSLQLVQENMLELNETQASYVLAVQPGGSMKALTYSLNDQYTGQQVVLTPGQPYAFTVTASDPASFASNRFSLAVSAAGTIDLATSVKAAPYVCEGMDAQVDLASTQQGMTYAIELNGKVIRTLQGSGNAMSMAIPASALTSNANTVRVKVNSGCSSEYLTTSLSIGTVGIATVTATDVNQCHPGLVTVSAAGIANGGQYRWYDALESSSPIGTGASIDLNLSNSAVVYVAGVNAAGCEGLRVPVQITVTNAAEDILAHVSSKEVCAGEMVTLSATKLNGEAGSFRWYERITDVTPLKEATTVDVTVGRTSHYYVSFVNAAGCESNRVAALVTVRNFAPVLTATTDNAATCLNGSMGISVNGAPQGSQYAWYADATATTPVAYGASWTVDNLQQSTTWWVEAISPDGCRSARTSVTALVDTSNPVANLNLQASAVCNDGQTTITFNKSTEVSNLLLYMTATGGEPIAEGTQELQMDGIHAATTYYVSALNKAGCESERIAVAVPYKTVQTPEITPADQAGHLILTSTTALSYQWYVDGAIVNGSNSDTYEIKDISDHTYTVEVLSDAACPSIMSAPINSKDFIKIILGVEHNLGEAVHVYPNPATREIMVRMNDQFEENVKLYDLSGSLMMESKLPASSGMREGSMEVGHLARGLYLVKVLNGSQVVVKKILLR